MNFDDFEDPEAVPPPPPAPKPPPPVVEEPPAAPNDGPYAENDYDLPPDPQAEDRRERAAKTPEDRAFASVEGRVPPHDLDAEAAVLSAILMRGAEGVSVALPYLAAEQFYSAAHRLIYDACVELYHKDQTIDVITVGSYLKDRTPPGSKVSRLAQVGGMPYIGSIMDSAPVVTDKHLVAYATRVRDRARLRELQLILARAYAQSFAIPDDGLKDFFEKAETDIQKVCGEQHDRGLTHIGPALVEMVQEVDDQRSGKTLSTGISTGFVDVDNQTGGLFESDLTVVGARPGMGKTSYVLGITKNVAQRDYVTAFFSLEMPRKQLAQRLTAAEADINMLSIRRANMNDLDYRRMTSTASILHRLQIYVDDTPGISIAEIAAKCRRLHADCTRKGKKLGLVVVDYLQLMKIRNPDKEVQGLGENTMGLKNLAKLLSCPVVCLSQLNRAVETRTNKRPNIADLRASGSIEQDADNVVFLYRDEYYNEESAYPGIVEVDIAKQRNGPTGVVKLAFRKHATSFHNLAYSDQHP